MEEYIFNYALVEDGKIKLEYTYQGENIIKYFNNVQDLSNFKDLDKITNPDDIIEYFNLELG